MPPSIHCVQIQLLLSSWSTTFFSALSQDAGRTGSCKCLGKTDTTDYYRNRLLVNMERARWQYALDKGQKYVIANVAAFMLQAINEETDSILEMRICVGSVKIKLLCCRAGFIIWN